MSDIVSKEQRSRNMSAIRSKDTKPELYIRKLLYADGYFFITHKQKISASSRIPVFRYRWHSSKYR